MNQEGSATRLIQLPSGETARVDEDVYQKLGHRAWYISKSGAGNMVTQHRTKPYVTAKRTLLMEEVRRLGLDPSRKYNRHLHKEIIFGDSYELIDSKKIQIDHFDRDTLNCVRANLYQKDQYGNQINKGKPNRKNGSTSVYKGVSRSGNKWLAQITYRGTHYDLGRFSDEVAAAVAYDMKALELVGNQAKTNFPIKRDAQAVESA